MVLDRCERLGFAGWFWWAILLSSPLHQLLTCGDIAMTNRFPRRRGRYPRFHWAVGIFLGESISTLRCCGMHCRYRISRCCQTIHKSRTLMRPLELLEIGNACCRFLATGQDPRAQRRVFASTRPRRATAGQRPKRRNPRAQAEGVMAASLFRWKPGRDLRLTRFLPSRPFMNIRRPHSVFNGLYEFSRVFLVVSLLSFGGSPSSS